jgi:pimeloyl-ACP methyl ester carboxylesterase
MSTPTGVKPTIVLVHGAFADASSWNGVIKRLQQQGYTVIAPANPLRGVAADSAYTASLLGQIKGPVLLAGHSYGGAVISNAVTSAPNVLGLVFVAAFAPEEGETLGDVESGSKDSVLNTALVQYTYPAGPAGQNSVEFAINPALIREAFAADLPPEVTALTAATQRPVAAAAFSDVSGPPAWKKLPFLGGGRDRRQGRRRRRRPFARAAGGRGHRRGRGLARDHDLPAGGGDRPHRRGGPGRRRFTPVGQISPEPI